MNDDTPEAIWNQITAILEEHNTILKSHRENFEHLIKEVGQIKRRLEKLEAADSIDSNVSNDAKFIADTTARLKAISAALDAKA
jgi:chemotaxis regulatin CheY-phosphate phosphatase CheZ